MMFIKVYGNFKIVQKFEKILVQKFEKIIVQKFEKISQV